MAKQERPIRKRDVIIFAESSLRNGDGVILDAKSSLKIDMIESSDGETNMPIIGFEANEDLIRQINEVKDRTGGVTRAEILRKALKIYDVLTRKAIEGKEVGVVDGQGHVVEKLILP